MRKTTPNKQNSLKVICDIFGHKYEVSKKVTSHVKEYKCKCCNKELTTNSNGDLIELTPKYIEINSMLERIYRIRSRRLKERTFTTPQYAQLRKIA